MPVCDPVPFFWHSILLNLLWLLVPFSSHAGLEHRILYLKPTGDAKIATIILCVKNGTFYGI
ncbi:MAG TPA: hypothetical protein VFX43_17945, partial [Chitinophagaceae bacterium]|nr:hypothetical protein [Chitinophagaceae bacterium]